MGIVAATPHQSGRTKSAIRPSPTKNIQKILRSTTFILNLGHSKPGAKYRGLVRPEFASSLPHSLGVLAARVGLSRVLAAVMTAMAKNEGGSAEADTLPSFVAAAIQ